jgi:membrane-associated progesterone receptor component
MEPAVIAAGSAMAAGAAAIWLSGAENRRWRAKLAENELKERELQERRAQLAYIEPKKRWSEEELRQYDGSDPDGPILLAVDGTVFNVYKGRNFYGKGGEYSVMAGRDATRLLAKTSLEEETEEEKKRPLSIAEKAALEGWYWTFKNKYDIVGELEGYSGR